MPTATPLEARRLHDLANATFEGIGIHAEGGVIAPDDFISLAEETGLIIPLGEWVLRIACAAAAGWPEQLRVAVNLSPVQFGRFDPPQLVDDVLRANRLAPERLELEITEGVLIKDLDQALSVPRRLKAQGVRIATISAPATRA